MRSNYPIIRRTSHQMNNILAFHMGLYLNGTRDIRIYCYNVLENHLINQLRDFTSIVNDMLTKVFFANFG